MTLFRKIRVFLTLLSVFSFGISTIGHSQARAFSSLIADNIHYDSAGQKLIAEGNVIVIFEGTRLEADKIVYDAFLGRVFAEGGIRITDGNDTIFIASAAELSTDLREGIIYGARLLLANQFQISAAEIRRTDGRFNTLYRTVGSSCQVCFDRPVPLWQIRASRIVHDTEAQRFYFENARFEVLGLPILFLPSLRMVDPSVTRATGLLGPNFISSDLYGFAMKLPYFITLGDHADITITPFLTSSGAFLLEGEFRQRYANGHIYINSAFALSDGAGNIGTGFLNIDSEFNLSRDRNFYADMKFTNDDGFLRRFGFDQSDRLVSKLGVRRYRNDSFFEIGAVFFQSLRDDEIDAEIPFVLPEISFRKTWEDPLLGGRIGLNFNSVGLFRKTGRDVFRVSGSADWRRDWNAPLGIRASTFAEIHVDTYKVWDDIVFGDNLLFRLTPIIGAEMRLPLLRNGNNNVLHVLEPVIQLVYTPEFAFNDDVPNEDSLQVEFDETNLFSINRFPGFDNSETGFRANIGGSYRRYDPSGWTLGVDLGQVFRTEENTQFSDGSGLAGLASDTLAAVSFELPGEVRVINRLLMGRGFEIRRAESEILVHRDSVDLDLSYVYLAADVTAGSPDARSEANLVASYKFRSNWQARVDWRRDLIENQNISAGIGLVYGNECVEIDLYLSRRFTTSMVVPAETSFDVSVRLAGFGGGLQNEWPAQQCLQLN